MLPLISSALPATPAVPSQNAPASASLVLGSGTTDASAASRQQLPNAVIATGAPAAYFPGTAPQRDVQSTNDRTLRIPVPPPTGDYIEVKQPPAPPAAATRMSAPVTLGIPLTTQLNAQFLAQQVTRAPAENTMPEPVVRDVRPSPTKGREPSLSNASGASAYSIAAARSALVDAASELEAAAT